MKFYFILIALMVTTIEVFSQNNVSMNMAMRNKLASKGEGNEKMYLLVKGDVKSIHQFVNRNNGIFIGSAGDIASVRLSLYSISQLVEKSFVKVIGSDVHHYITMNDTMRMRAFVNQVQAGQPPLSRPYKGKGIILGIIDSGIDFHHPDFIDSTGHTRVKWLWDMNLPDSINSPLPYGYGQEFSGQQIDSGLATAHTGQDQFGHGTYVAGIAAGNGSAVGHFQGVAPESDLIIVGYNFTAMDTVPRMAHAVEYIFNKAQQLGKPCVINASLGDYDGSHDGLDLESQFISNLISQQPGRVMVAACGDIGTNYPFHLGRNSVTGDTVFTWFNYTAGIGFAYVEIFSDTADFRNVHFALGADKVTPYFSFRGQTAFTTVFPSINHIISQTLMNGAHRIGRMQTLTTINAGVYKTEITILPDSTDYYWRFITTGNGRYDSWTYDIYHPSWVYQNLPPDSIFPDILHYYSPDTVETIVSGFNCLDNVISVGNYTNTDRHVDVDSVLQIVPSDLPQQIATNSGRGPTRDGRIKPELMAPGNHIISCGVLSLIPGIQHYKIALGGFHITGGGTSASAPVVAGIAALYLEENPGATWMDVKSALTTCAFQDSFMWGPYPNNAWGYGKVNAFEALTTCSLINNVSLINDDKNSCVIYPNPAGSFLNVDIPAANKTIAAVYDMDGRKLFFSDFYGEKFSIPLSLMKPGVYILHLMPVNREMIMKKVVIER